MEIVEEIDGAASVDAAGGENCLRINAENISDDAYDSEFFTFRLQRTVLNPVYLRVRITGPISDGESIYIDQMAIIKGKQLYPGGPFAAAFSGATAAVKEDKWVLTASNDRGGEFQTWYNRAFDMAKKELLLPTSGSNLIADALIG